MPDFQAQIPAHDGDDFGVYIARPKTTPAPAVIVIQEIFGVNQELRAKCDALAELGYVAIAPDLFWRIAEKGLELNPENEDELQRAFDLYGEFDAEKGIKDLKSTLAFARDHEDVISDSVGCVGFCLGGFLAFAMAVESDVDAAVSYYGVSIPSMLDKKDKITKPLLMHIAEKDQFVSAEEQTQMQDALGDHAQVTMYTYEGEDHAFARFISLDASETEGAGGLANSRTRDFFANTLKPKAEAA